MNDGMIKIDSEDGKTLGFTSDKFHKHSWLWKVGTAMYVSFVASVRPKQGDFRRLVGDLLAQGYTVKIPTPLGRMSLIVRQADYRKTEEVTEQGDTCQVWVLTPPPDPGTPGQSAPQSPGSTTS